MNEFDQLLAELQTETAKALLAKIKSGEATAADLNVARQLLKDNDWQALSGTNKEVDSLKLALPFPQDEQAEVA